MAVDQQVGGGAGAIDDALLDQPQLPLDGGDAPHIEPNVEVAQEDQSRPAAPPQSPPNDDVAQQLELERRAKVAAAQQAHQERQARIQAEQYAAAAYQGMQATQRDLIKNEIFNSERLGEQLEAQLAASLQSQDVQTAAKLQRELSKLEAKLLWLNDGLAQIDDRAAQAPVQQQPARQQAPVAAADDGFEAAIASLAPESQQWLRRNPQYVQNPQLHQRLIQAHHVVEYEGYQANTPAYFQAIEAKLGLRPAASTASNGQGGRVQGHAGRVQDRVQSQGNQRTSVPTVAAPVGRSNGITSNPAGGPIKVKLSAVEVQIAKDLGMSPEEYAKGKVARDRLRSQQQV